MSFVVSYEDDDVNLTMPRCLREYGVCVIEDVFSETYCNTAIDKIVSSFEQLGTGITRGDIDSWNSFNCPPQMRPGMFHCLMANLPIYWRLRTHKKISWLFRTAYSDLREKQIDSTIVAPDGVNIKPNNLPLDDGKDWAHVDQMKGDIFDCIQGQIALSNTTASFVCSPKSHLCFKRSSRLNINTKGKFTGNILQIDKTKKMVEKVGGEYQIPIIAKKGSVILWLSSVIHSNKLADRIEENHENDNWNGWRFAVYVCHHPSDEFTQKQKEKIERNIRANRVMNHTGLRTFPKLPYNRFFRPIQLHEHIETLLREPEELYTLLNIDVEKLIQKFYSTQ